MGGVGIMVNCYDCSAKRFAEYFLSVANILTSNFVCFDFILVDIFYCITVCLISDTCFYLILEIGMQK